MLDPHNTVGIAVEAFRKLRQLKNEVFEVLGSEATSLTYIPSAPVAYLQWIAEKSAVPVCYYQYAIINDPSQWIAPSHSAEARMAECQRNDSASLRGILFALARVIGVHALMTSTSC